MLKTIKLDLPDEIIKELAESEEALSLEMKKLAVIKLFAKKKITSSQGAKLLGMTRQEFLDFLSSEGVPYFDFEPEEFEKGLKNLRSVLGKS